MTDRRDFCGSTAALCWPHDARLAVSFVINVEEGAELSVADGDEGNESTYEIREEVTGAPDPCMESHFAYGSRVGLWRVMEVLDRYGVKATFSCSASASEAERTPFPTKYSLKLFTQSTLSQSWISSFVR